MVGGTLNATQAYGARCAGPARSLGRTHGVEAPGLPGSGGNPCGKDGREPRGLFLRLAAGADAVIEQFRPGVAARLGIDYETVRAARRRGWPRPQLHDS